MKRAIFGAILILTMGGILNAKTYATVDGEAITENDFKVFERAIPNFNYDSLSPQEKKMAIEQIIERKLIAKEAKKSGVESTKEYKDAMEEVKSGLLLDVYLKREMDKINKVAVSNAETKKFYDDNKDRFVQQQAKARHNMSDKFQY